MLYLCLERNAVLASEDGGFRSLASNMGVQSSIWAQPILMVLRDGGVITLDRYSEIVIGKLNRRHNFTSINAKELLCAAKKSPQAIPVDIRSALETFRHPGLDIRSGANVCGEFLTLLLDHVKPRVLADYFRLLEEVLLDGRESLAYGIHEQLRVLLIERIQQMGKKQAHPLVDKLRNLLSPIRIPRPRKKPLVVAVRAATAIRQQYETPTD